MSEENKTISTSSQITAFGSIPDSWEAGMKIAKYIASSDMAPNDCRGKPESVLLRLAMGAEVGLSPLQSIQNIAVINGRPALWGDAALAVCQNSPQFEYINETFDEKTLTATCEVKRKGMNPVIRNFSKDDALLAGLWDERKEIKKQNGSMKNPSPWFRYPKRMLQMRARGFSLRDAFADALKGINIREELEDYPKETRNITPKKGPEPKEFIEEEVVSAEDKQMILDTISSIETVEELKNFWRTTDSETKVIEEIVKAFQLRSSEIQASQTETQETQQ